LIALASVNLLTPLLGISYLVANSIGIALGVAWNWLFSSRVVWAEAGQATSPPTPLQTSWRGELSRR
jgi:hypothetical protein